MALALLARRSRCGGRTLVADQVEKPTVPPDIVAQPLAPAPSRIADMLTATAEGRTSRAWYSHRHLALPPRRLGDKPRAASWWSIAPTAGE